MPNALNPKYGSLNPQTLENPLITDVQSFAVVDDDAPTGNALHIAPSASGAQPHFVCNAIGTANVAIPSVPAGDLLPVRHNLDPVGNLAAVPVKLLESADADSRFEADLSSFGGIDAYVTTATGRLVKVAHNASPSAVAVICHDATPALEATTAGNADTTQETARDRAHVFASTLPA